MPDNLFAKWRAVFALGPLQVGEVTAYQDGVATVQLPGGGLLHARGSTTLGAHVFVRDGLIEGPAPNLPLDSAEV